VKVHSFRVLACAAIITFSGVACTPMATEPLAEKLDPNTGTTVAVASKALELIADKQRGTSRDPFAYVGPFETNKQGAKQLYIWIAAPQDKGQILEPTLYCDSKPLQFEPLHKSMKEIGLSKQPYTKAAPWAAQWFYHLTEENLTCLAEAKRIALVTQVKSGKQPQESFSAEGEDLKLIAAFAASR
jgi:hypothetical protein